MKELIDKKLLYFGFGTALLFEITSFSGFFLPEFSTSLTLFLTIIFAAICVRDLRLGLYLLFVELAIGGHGYFLRIEVGDVFIAIRHIWFVVLMFTYFVTSWRHIFLLIKESDVTRRLVFVGIICALSVSIAYVKGYPISHIFSDANAYVFYLLLFPILLVKEKLSKNGLLNIIFGALLVLSIKTILTLAIFSNSLLIASQWYVWVRDLRFGEITHVNPDFRFFRVFFQSQVLLLPALIMIGSYLLHAKATIQKEERNILLILSSFFIASLLLSFSRSFWVGVIASVIAGFILLAKYRKSIFTNVRSVLGHYLSASLLAFILLGAAQSFVFSGSVFLYRFSDIDDEPAAASRWALLPEMIEDIQLSPVFGNGFGHEITYITDDPRIRAATGGTGEYTTFALEWSYLDIWLKMGLVGLGALVYLFAYFLRLQVKNMRDNGHNWYAFGMAVSLIALICLNFFTPYLNHPIGIGYLALGLL